MTDRICPETGVPMRRGVRPMTLQYKESSVTIEIPGWYPEGAGEGVHSGEDMKISDRALNRLKAEVDQLPSPQEIKRIRRKLGLTQEQAGALIGGGPRAFQKYEVGDLVPSRAVSSALALLDRDPDGLDVLTGARRVDADRVPAAPDASADP